jgi:RNA polymerase sigma factor (TIGR02999 family)
VDTEKVQNWNSRWQFFSAAAEAMRRILVENARRKKRTRHGGQLQRVAMPEADPASEGPDSNVLAVSEGLEKLAQVNAPAAELIKLHFFAGLTLDKAAQSLDISPRKAYRLWAYGRAWLYRFVAQGEGQTGRT